MDDRSTLIGIRATLRDLMQTEGKTELIGGKIVRYPCVGVGPAMTASEIAFSLYRFVEATGIGQAATCVLGYAIPELPSGRESFQADASFTTGPEPENPMDFMPGPPSFAVEVRGFHEIGIEAEAAMAAKRADYFEAGTLVVWDVDTEAEVIRSDRTEAPARPVLFLCGSIADAEPAVPRWRVESATLFDAYENRVRSTRPATG